MSLALLEVDGPIATLILNRPDKLNSIAWDMRNDMFDAITELEQYDQVRVLVITGAGSGFCAGTDVEVLGDLVDEQNTEELRGLVRTGGRFIRALRALRFPVIAAINGIAAGTGLNLALACDLRIAASTARFGQIAVRCGLVPDWGGSYFLPRLVGPGQAMRLMMTGDMIDAQEALRIGLVDQVVPLEQLGQAVLETSLKLANGPPFALARIKAATYKSLEGDMNSVLEAEEESLLKCFLTADAQEGLRAVRERRPPEFSGR